MKRDIIAVPHTIICFLSSKGGQPYFFLNALEKYFSSAKPQAKEISLTESLFSVKSSNARFIRSWIKYCFGDIPKYFANALCRLETRINATPHTLSISNLHTIKRRTESLNQQNNIRMCLQITNSMQRGPQALSLWVKRVSPFTE